MNEMDCYRGEIQRLAAEVRTQLVRREDAEKVTRLEALAMKGIRALERHEPDTRHNQEVAGLQRMNAELGADVVRYKETLTIADHEIHKLKDEVAHLEVHLRAKDGRIKALLEMGERFAQAVDQEESLIDKLKSKVQKWKRRAKKR
jgi:hypothetical protein